MSPTSIISNTDRQPSFFYHIGDCDPSSIRVKVTLREVSGRDDGNADIDLSESAEAIVTWQSKVKGPIHSKSEFDPIHRIAEIITKDGDDGVAAELQDHDISIYTKSDSDFFIPQDDNKNSLDDSPTNSKAPSTNLASAAKYFSIRNLISNETLDDAAINIHDRISRDDNSKVMYILAAIKSSNPNLVTDDDSKGLDNPVPVKDCSKLFHEQVLCRLKLHQDGMMEVSPGFSIQERLYFDGDSEIFMSPEHLFVMQSRTEGSEETDNKKSALTRFTFSVPGGSIYQYTLEWLERMDDANELESLSLQLADEEYLRLSERRKNIQTITRQKSIGVIGRGEEEELLHLEIVSADNFHIPYIRRVGFSQSAIHIRYHIHQSPRSDGWSFVNIMKENRSNVRGDSNDGHDSLHGQTMATTRVQFRNNRIPVLRFIPTIVFVCAILKYGFQIDLMKLFIFLFLLRILTDIVSGETDGYIVDEFECPYYSFGHHFSLRRTRREANDVRNAGKHRDSVRDIRVTLEEDYIRMTVQVFAKYSDKTESILGVGSVQFPIAKRMQTLQVPTCRLVGKKDIPELLSRIKDRHVGCTFDEIQKLYKNAQSSGHGCTTESAGTVTIKIQNISRDLVHARSTGNANRSNMPMPILLEPIEEVLARSRQKRRERDLEQASSREMDDQVAAMSNINKRIN